MFQCHCARAIDILGTLATDAACAEATTVRLAITLIELYMDTTDDKWHAVGKAARPSLKHPYLVAIADYMLGEATLSIFGTFGNLPATSRLSIASNTALPAASIVHAAVYNSTQLSIVDRLAYMAVHCDDTTIHNWTGSMINAVSTVGVL